MYLNVHTHKLTQTHTHTHTHGLGPIEALGKALFLQEQARAQADSALDGGVSGSVDRGFTHVGPQPWAALNSPQQSEGVAQNGP